jgi:hypothetical protein
LISPNKRQIYVTYFASTGVLFLLEVVNKLLVCHNRLTFFGVHSLAEQSREHATRNDQERLAQADGRVHDPFRGLIAVDAHDDAAVVNQEAVGGAWQEKVRANPGLNLLGDQTEVADGLHMLHMRVAWFCLCSLLRLAAFDVSGCSNWGWGEQM